MTTETFRIVVELDTKGAATGSQQVRNELSKVEKSADRLRNVLHRALTFAGVTFGVREIIRLVDAYTNLQNKLRTVTSSNIQLERVTRELFKVSQDTRSSFTTTAQVYARTASATKNLGLSQKELINFTTRLNQAVALSGSTSTEASNALLQLSQGMASQALRGEELRSVLEQLPVVADVIAKEFKVVRGGLRELGAQGVITPQRVIQAFAKMGDELRERFGQLLPTLSQGFQVLGNAIVRYVGELNKSTGFGANAARALVFLAENIDTVARVVGALALIIGTGLVKGALALLIGALGTIGAGFAVVTALTITFADKIKLSSDGFASLYDVAAIVFKDLTNFAIDFFDTLDYLYNDLPTTADGSTREMSYSFEDFAKVVAAVFDSIMVGANIVFGFLSDGFTVTFNNILKGIETVTNLGIKGINNLPGRLAPPMPLVNFNVGSQERRTAEQLKADAIALSGDAAFNYVTETLNKAKADAAARKAQEEALNKLLGGDPGGEGGGGTGNVSGASKKQLETFDDLFAKLLQETQLISMNRREREAAEVAIRMEDQLKRELTDTERDLVTQQVQLNQALADQQAIYEQIRGPQDEFAFQVTALDELFKQGRISVEEYNVKLRELQMEVLSTDRSLSGGLKRGLLEITDQFTNLADVASTTLTNAFTKLEDTLVEFVKTGKLSFKDLASSIVGDLARVFVRANFTSIIGNVLGGALGGKPASGSAGGLGSLASGGGNILSGIMNGFSTPIFDPFDTAMAIGDTLGLGLESTIGMVDNLANFTPGASLAGFGGNLLANSLLGERGIGSSIGGTIGGLAGTYFGGPVGAAIGSFLGNAVGGLFGNNKPSSKLQSGIVDLETGEVIERGGLTGKKFDQGNFDAVTSLSGITSGIAQALGIVEKLSLAVGNRSGFEYALTDDPRVFDTDSDIRKQFESPGELIDGLLTEFQTMFPDKFSESVRTALGNIDFGTTQKEMEQALSDLSFAIGFDKAFDGIEEPVYQLKTVMDANNKIFDEAAKTAERLGLSVDKVREAQARANSEFLKTVNQGVYDAILEFTDPAGLARLQEERRFEAQLNEIKSVNGDVEAVYELHRLRMLQIERSANQEEINMLSERADEARGLAEAYRQLGKSLQDTINAIKLGDLSTLSPLDKLDTAKGIFGDTLNRALLGDQEALNELGAIGNSVIELSYAQNASNELFAADQAMVLDGLARARDVALRQVDVQTRIADTLTQQLTATVEGFRLLNEALAGRLSNSTGASPYIDPYTGGGKNAAGVSLTSASSAYNLSVGQVESIYRSVLNYSGASGSGQLDSLANAAGADTRARINAEIKKAAGFADGGITPTNGFFTVGERGKELGSFNTSMRVTPIEDAGELLAEMQESNEHLRAAVIVLQQGMKAIEENTAKTKENTARIAEGSTLAKNRRAN